MERWRTLDEIAGYLSVSERTVRRLMLDGLPFTRVGARLRFRASAVDSWLAVRAGVREGAVIPLHERRSA